MGLSETIVAAMIGAIATVSTALFQLFQMLRSNSKSDSRPKRGSPLRSFFAVLMLMVASAGGGFLYSELLKQRAAQDIQAMRDELNGKLQALAVSTEHLASISLQERMKPEIAKPATVQSNVAYTAAPAPATAESVIFAPACETNAQTSAACSEANGQRTALCAALPRNGQLHKVDLYVGMATAHDLAEESKVEFEQDLGGAKFTGKPVEYLQGAAAKTLCVNFLHWSEHAHVARMVLHYGPSLESEPSHEQTLVPAVVTQSSLPTAQAMTLSSAVQ